MLRSPSQVIALRRAPDSDILSLKQQAMLYGAVPSSIQSPGRRRSCVICVPGGLSCSISEEARSASSCVSPTRSRTRPCRCRLPPQLRTPPRCPKPLQFAPGQSRAA
jgi:hypothetical protein